MPKRQIGIPLGRRALLTAAGSAAAATLLPFGSARAEAPPLKLGLFLEYTGGSSGTTSESVQFGADMAVAELNAAGGIAGRKITRVTADTQTDATVGVGEMKRLVQQEKVDFVIGPVISQILMAAAPVLNDAKIPSFGSTGSLAITPQVAPYYFSTLVAADAQAQKMVAYAADTLHVKSGAIISDDGAQAKDFVQAMRKEIAARGLKLTGVQEFQYRATDMTPQLLSLRRGAPETLFLFASSGEDAGNIVKSLGDVGWDPKVTGNWTVGTFVDAMEKITGKDALENVTGSNYAGFSYCKGAPEPAAFLGFLKRAQAFDAKKFATVSHTMAAIFYDAVMLFKAAVEGNGGHTDGPSVAAWIEQNGKSFKGIGGPISPTKESHFLYGPSSLAIIRPGHRGPVGTEESVTC